MRQENSPSSTYTPKASTEEKTSACSASTRSTETSIMGNHGTKPLRTCKQCGKEAHHPLDLDEFKYSTESKYNRQNLCNACYDHKYMKKNNERRISFKGKQIYIAVNVRVNICEVCGATRQQNQGKQMALHHDHYNKGNPLDYTVEECLVCHGKERGKKDG